MYNDDNVGFIAGAAIILVAIATGITIAEWLGFTDSFISWFA